MLTLSQAYTAPAAPVRVFVGGCLWVRVSGWGFGARSLGCGLGCAFLRLGSRGSESFGAGPRAGLRERFKGGVFGRVVLVGLVTITVPNCPASETGGRRLDVSRARSVGEASWQAALV